MKIIHAATEFSGTRKVSLAIGFFRRDPSGHQQTIREAMTDARQHKALSLVITFDRHPEHRCRPRVPPLIYSLPQNSALSAPSGRRLVVDPL